MLFYVKTLLFSKNIIPNRIHVTEMILTLQIRYKTIYRRLELRNWTWSLNLRFEYSTKPPCTAILLASCYGIKEGLHMFLGISHHEVCMIVHKVVTLHDTVLLGLCVRLYSIRWFHIYITVVAACPALAEMLRFDKQASS